MAPIPLKCIVSVSSEDPLNPAKSILYGGKVGKKWLCSTSDKSGCLEMVVELCKRSKISIIEVGNFGTAFIEVLVGNSESPDDYITLLPSSMLMTIPDSKAGRSKTKTKTFTSKDKLSGAAVGKKWNRLKIRCVQKHSKEQFGLQYITFSNDMGGYRGSPLVSGGLEITLPSHHHLLTPPQLTTPQRTSIATPKSEPTINRPRLPSLQKSLTPAKTIIRSEAPLKTPKRPLQEKNGQEHELEEEDFEFSGLEKQSRLFRNCLKGKPSTNSDHSSEKEPNPILERIITEREKYSESSSTGLYQRRKLLKRELPKAAVSVDFTAGYKESSEAKKKAGGELSGAWRRMACHDNDYEIGEEPEHTWGWDRYKGKPKLRRNGRGKTRKHDNSKLDGWMSKRKKINNLIDECETILSAASEHLTKKLESSNEAPDSSSSLSAANLSSLPGCSKDGKTKGCMESEDSDCDTVIYDYKEEVGGDKGEEPSCDKAAVSTSMVECPLCGEFFPRYAIEVHAGNCGEPQIAASAYSIAMPIIID